MYKKNQKRVRKDIAILQICNLILAIIAFSFLISLSNVNNAMAYEVSERYTNGRSTIEIISKNAEAGEITFKTTGGGFESFTETWPERTLNQLISEDNLQKILPNNPGGLPKPTEVGGTGGVRLTPEQLIKKGALTEALDSENFDGALKIVGEIEGMDKEAVKTLSQRVNELIEAKKFDEARKLIESSIPAPYAGVKSPLGAVNLGLGQAVDYIAAGALWAVSVYGIVQLAGSILGFEPAKVNAVSTAAAAGVLGGHVAKALGAQSGLWKGWLPGATGWGIVVGIVVLELMYKEESKQIVTFECNPWEAPSGGGNCEKCNSDLYPCTEYRCKSLGQACQLLNPGTGEEKCAWVNPNDVNSPIMQTWLDVLTPDHSYKPNNAIRPPDRGVKIEYNKATDKCVKAFSPLTFGIQVNEPAQCKIDYNRTNKFDEMAYYFGSSNIYKYNHTQTLRLPSPDHINANAPEIKADGNYNLYVRCKDANGNENNDLFVFNFCVEKGPDATAPKIEATSIANNMPFQFGLNKTDIEVYLNEPSECKWSRGVDMTYEQMEETMTCSSNVWEMNNLMLYKCKDTLTGLKDREDNDFYFRCLDQPWLKGTDKENDRNVNQEGYKFTLKGTQPLVIDSVKPGNETIKGSGTLATLYLELETSFGYNLGDSWCSFSLTQNEKDYIRMFETGTNKHRQRLDLGTGTYTYYFQCVDLGGNAAKSKTTFVVEIDNQAPKVVRAYQDSGKLKIITDEKSSCSYSNNNEKKCNFAINEGANMPYSNSTEHSADWKKLNFYIKCQDINARQPNPNECSIIVRPES